MSMLSAAYSKGTCCSVDDHVDATRFGKSFERFANLILQRCKQFLPATIVSSLRVFTFTLNIFFQLLQLIDLGLQRTLIDRRAGRRVCNLLISSSSCCALVCIWVSSSLTA